MGPVGFDLAMLMGSLVFLLNGVGLQKRAGWLEPVRIRWDVSKLFHESMGVSLQKRQNLKYEQNGPVRLV